MALTATTTTECARSEKMAAADRDWSDRISSNSTFAESYGLNVQAWPAGMLISERAESFLFGSPRCWYQISVLLGARNALSLG